MRYDLYYCDAMSQQKQDAPDFSEIDLLQRKLQKPQWSGPMAPTCVRQAHVRAHGHGQAGPGASGPASQGSARECEAARLGLPKTSAMINLAERQRIITFEGNYLLHDPCRRN